jgi:hypothetical protein
MVFFSENGNYYTNNKIRSSLFLKGSNFYSDNQFVSKNPQTPSNPASYPEKVLDDVPDIKEYWDSYDCLTSGCLDMNVEVDEQCEVSVIDNLSPTATPVPPTATPTATPVQPTATPAPTPTSTGESLPTPSVTT